MTRTELLTRMSEVLGEIVDDEKLSLTDEVTADDVDDWDSTNHVRFIVALESEFGIRFESDEIGAPENVGQLAKLIETKLAGL